MRRKKALMRRYKQKTPGDKRNASCSNKPPVRLEERHSSPERENDLHSVKTLDLSDDGELSSFSPELSEGSPEPVTPPVIRPIRMTLLPPESKKKMYPFARAGRSRQTPPVRSRVLQTPPVPAAPDKKNNKSKAHSVPPRQAHSPATSTRRERFPRIVPRTRILVTPDRLTPPGLPPRRNLRALCTLKRKTRKRSKKNKVRQARHRSLTFNKDGSSRDGNDGDVSSDVSADSVRSRREPRGDSADGDNEGGPSDDNDDPDDQDSDSSATPKKLPKFNLIRLVQM